MNASNVMRVECSEDAYHSAVATIIGDIQKIVRDGKPLTLIDIAEDIKVSLGTISNAKNEKGSMSAEFLARLGRKYGAAYLNPYFALFGAQATPLERKRLRDILPIALRFSHKVAAARDPDGPGGPTEVPQERMGYLADAKELQRELGCLTAEIAAG